MAHMSRQIRVNEATAGLRTVTFRCFDSTTGEGKTDLSASTVKIRTNGGSGSNSTNNFAHTSDGYYDVVLTQSEVNITIGYHLQIGPVGASGYVIVPAEAVIVPSDAFDTGATTAQIASACRDDFIDMLQDGVTRPDTTGNATFKDSSGSTQNVSITTSGSALPITAMT